MAALAQSKLKALLTGTLKLRNPRFVLERTGTMVSGSIISESFAGKDDLERQISIRDAVDAALGPDSRKQVGTLLAYTPDEWDVDLEAAQRLSRAKAG
jgi:acid stress-induced BolA-like protein IbaG/YrbA